MVELNKYSCIYRCQLNFGMFCATIPLGISRRHFNHSNLLVHSVYRLLVYFHVRMKLHHLCISLLHKDGFSKVKNFYIESAYYSVFDDYGVNADKTYVQGDWF